MHTNQKILKDNRRLLKKLLKSQEYLLAVLSIRLTLFSTQSENNLLDLVNSRLRNENLINSIRFKFSGDGKLYSFDGSLIIRGGQRVFTLFAPQKLQEEVQLLTAYEKTEIFLDTVFGLKHTEQGCVPASLRDGSLANLVKYKFKFVLGRQRDGHGKKYGHTKTRNHFSDHPDCQGSFPAVGKGEALTVGQHSLQKVTDFFDSYQAQTDYERLKVLFDVLLTVGKS